MDRVTEYIKKTLGHEGRYVNHPSDRGGPTKWGITEATARRHGYTGEMINLPKSTAIAIYRSEYYADPDFDLVAIQAPDVAYRLFDAGVLCGTEKPVRWLQTALNAFNLQQDLYRDMKVDGRIGPTTLGCLRKYLAHRGQDDGEFVLVEALESLFGHYLFTISGNIEDGLGREQNEDFIYGWFLNRVGQ